MLDNNNNNNDYDEDRTSSFNYSLPNAKINEVDNMQEAYEFDKNMALSDERTNYSLVESNVLRITSNSPIIDKNVEENSTKQPIIQKIQGEYIEVGGGEKYGFFKKPDANKHFQEMNNSDPTLSTDTKDDVNKDIITQR